MNYKKHLIISGILFIIVLVLWPVFMMLSQPTGSDEDQLNWVLNHLTLYKIQFFLAFLIAPSIIYLMLAQLGKQVTTENNMIKFGYIFIAGYAVLVSIAYCSQIILVPGLLKNGLIDQAKAWYFGSTVSATFFIDQLGYCFWGIGTIVLFRQFLNGKGIIRSLGILYLVSAVLSIIAFIGLILDNKLMKEMTLYSGLMLIPVAILTIILGYRENRTLNP